MMIGMLDIIFFVIILIVSVAATYRGFIREVLGKAAWVLSILTAIFFYDNFSVFLSGTIKNQTFRFIASFVILFLGVFLVVKIVEVILSKIISGEVIGGLNKAMGFLFGIAEGLVLVFAILFLLHIQSWVDISGVTKDSRFNNFYERQVEKIVYPEINIPEFNSVNENDGAA